MSLSAPILSSYASQFDNERTIDFLFVGRLEYQKGADQLTVIAEALESIGRLVVIEMAHILKVARVMTR